MRIEIVFLVGLLCAGVGLLLWLRAIVTRRRVYVARGTLLLVVGFATMFVPRQARGVGGWPWCENDKLTVALRERAEIERSLRWNVLPLIARCEADLQRFANTTSALVGEEQQRTAAERNHILAVLEEARQRQREHEQALAELGTAIGGLQRERALTQVKQVEHGRAMARVTYSELGSKTEGVLAERRAR
ncbi:MAG: hypothetical protein ABSE73_01095 [Planctomycetota bacterium]